ncbi:MAG: hypothetical protein ABI689_03235 [Thermoanaerobaculia bacterium]
MNLNRDFSDLFAALNAEGVRYLLVGGYAFSFHAVPRYTKDLDVWVEATPEMAPRTLRALLAFGVPAEIVEESDFAQPLITAQFGVPPNRIDILTAISGVEFADAWMRRAASAYGGVPIWVIGREDLKQNKRASGRKQDLLDVEKLDEK